MFIYFLTNVILSPSIFLIIHVFSTCHGQFYMILIKLYASIFYYISLNTDALLIGQRATSHNNSIYKVLG